jgi:DNA ligase (NAD+)
LQKAHLLPLKKDGRKWADNIIQGIEQSKTISFERLLFGLGIRYAGETVAKVLAKHFKTIDAIHTADFETLVAVDEIGGKIAESVVLYFSRQKNIDLINALKNSGLQFVSAIEDTTKSENLKGMKIVISGVFEQYSRAELKKMIEEHGGKNISSISKNTTFVLAGNNMGSSKKQKAEDLKVEIITEEEFLVKIS